MNRNKNLLTLYYSCKKLSKFSSAQINVFHAFSFHFCSTANSKFSFCVSLREINCIKNQTMSLNSKSIYFSRYCLCFIYFDVIIHQRLKKKFQLVELFFSHVKEHVVLYNNWYWACSKILSYGPATSSRLMEIRFKADLSVVRNRSLTLIWFGFLGVRFEVEGGG